MKPEFTKEVPKENGWYWVRYKNKHGHIVTCPSGITFFKVMEKREWCLDTALGDFITDMKEGEIEFGPSIPDLEPEHNVQYGESQDDD